VKRGLITVAAVAAALVCVALVMIGEFTFLVDTPRVRMLITGKAAQAVGRPVTLSSISLALLPGPAVRLKGLEVEEDPRFGTAPFLTVGEVDLQLPFRPLLSRRVEISSVVLRQPQVTLIQHADGALNAASFGDAHAASSATASNGGGAAAGAAALLPASVKIEDGVLNYVNQAGDGSTSQYRLEQLNLTLHGDWILTFEGNARLQPGDVAIGLTDGTVALNDDARVTEFPLRARLAIASNDVTKLFAAALGSAPAVGAQVKATLGVAGTLGAPTAAGSVELANAAITRTSPECPDPQSRTLSFPELKMDAVWNGDRLTSELATAQLGSGMLTAAVAVRLDGPWRIELQDVAITSLPLETLLVDFLCAGYAVTGALDLTGNLSFGAPRFTSTLTGFGQLNLRDGKVVGSQALGLLATVVRVGGAVSALLSADLPWSLFSSPLDFDSITATYAIANGVLSTRDLVYSSSAMKISAVGDYDLAAQHLDFDMVVNHGRGEAYVKVTGPADAPSIRVTPSTILRKVEPGQIAHGLGDLFDRFR